MWYFMYQYFPPFGWMSRYSPSPSNILYFLIRGLRARIPLSVSDTVLPPGIELNGIELDITPCFYPLQGCGWLWPTPDAYGRGCIDIQLLRKVHRPVVAAVGGLWRGSGARERTRTSTVLPAST